LTKGQITIAASAVAIHKINGVEYLSWNFKTKDGNFYILLSSGVCGAYRFGRNGSIWLNKCCCSIPFFLLFISMKR